MLNRRFRETVSRREVIRLMGLGAVFPLVPMPPAGAERVSGWWQAPGANAGTVTFPKGAVIRTLLKDLPPEALANGVTLFHEHLSEDLQPLPTRRCR